jgi:hypothetical protein
MRFAAPLLLLALTGIASADPVDDAGGKKAKGESSEVDEGQQLVLLNASAKLGDRGQIDRLRRVLDSRGLLLKLPARLEAQLDGRNVLIADIDAIKTSYEKMDFAVALEIVRADEERILQGAAGGDPIPALAELSQWRGLIAAGMEQPDEAVRWFRAAIRFNPAWTPDKKVVGPSVRTLIKKAHKEADEQGKLRVDAEPDNAMIQIDGGKPQSTAEKISLPIGMHLVVITAEGRTTYAELVDIKPDKTEKIEIALDKESKSDRAAKLVDAAVAAPPGKARLKKTKLLSPMAGGATRFLVIEEGSEDRVTVRVYDTNTKKVSKPLELEGTASSAAIARKVMAALEPDNMVEPSTVMIIEKQHTQRWYERWYVWVGVGAIVGGGIIGYQYMSREPTAVRGF